jgi:hypothetical protein
MTKINLCEKGNCSGKSEYITYHDIMGWVNVCEVCYDEIFYSKVKEGSQSFLRWAITVYGDVKGKEIVSSVFGEIEEMEEDYITMFTYGILKQPRNIKREGGINIVENCTVSGHKMFLYNGSFPITKFTENENDVIYGTLFDVPAYVVTTSYDFTEGYNPHRPAINNMYNRETVKVTNPNGEIVEAQMYVCNQVMFHKNLAMVENYIVTGNFDDRATHTLGKLNKKSKKRRGVK